MKVGNRTHAVALCAILLAALGYIALQVRAKMASPAPVQNVSTAGGRPDGARITLAELPRTVYGDPFSHLDIQRPAPQRKSGASAGGSAGRQKPSRLPGSLPDPFDGWGADESAGTAPTPVRPLPKGRLSVERDAPPVLWLHGIVGAESPAAFISIGDKPAEEFHEGDVIAGSATLKRIGEDDVEIELPKEKRSLRVGAKLQLQ